MQTIEPRFESLNEFKLDSYLEAFRRALVISDKDLGVSDCRLVAIGKWILNDPGLIASFSDWRERHKKQFVTWFDSSPEKTRGYLENFALRDSSRLLFCVVTNEGKIVGHMGIADFDPNSRTVKLDNMLRGESGGGPHLMRAAQASLIEWVYKNLNVSKVSLDVLDHNVSVINFHKSFGFIEETRNKLRLTESGYVNSSTVIDAHLLTLSLYQDQQI